MSCLDKDTKEFLQTLLDIVADMGAEVLKEMCVRGGSDCDIDAAQLQSKVSEARAAIKEMVCNE